MSRAVVVGAGLSGLVRARALARAGEDVAVLESAARSGGVVVSERRDGYLIEHGPNTVRPTPELWSLVSELGLAGQALFADRTLPRYVLWRDRLRPAPMGPGALVTTSLLSPAGKLRLLAEPFVRSRGAADETLRAFVSRRLGREAAERLVEPFVSGVWAGDAGRLSAEFAFPALVEWERSGGSLLLGAIAAARKPRPAGPRPPRGLLSFPDGLETLPRAIAAELGHRLSTGTRVEEVVPENGAWTVRAGGAARAADRLVLATPAAEAARLVASFAPDAARSLAEIPYAPLAVMHLAWPASAASRPLRGFGHLVAPRSGLRLLGAVWSSSLFPRRAPEDRLLVTAFAGGMHDPRAVELEDAALLEIAERELAGPLGLAGPPRLVSLRRHERGLPQYDPGHRGRIETLERAERRWPGLAFIGNYRGGVSVGDVVRNAARLSS